MCTFQGFAIDLTGVPVNDRHDLTGQLGWGGLCEANRQPSSLVAWTAGWIDSLVSIGGLCTAIWPSQRKCFLPIRSASTNGCLSFPWVWRGEGLRSEGPQHGCAHVMNVHSYKGTFAPQIQPYLVYDWRNQSHHTREMPAMIPCIHSARLLNQPGSLAVSECIKKMWHIRVLSGHTEEWNDVICRKWINKGHRIKSGSGDSRFLASYPRIEPTCKSEMTLLRAKSWCRSDMGQHER